MHLQSTAAKQYQRASVRHFREAAIDYAHAHPTAKVVISDYGALSDEAVRKIRNGCESQVEAFGDVHPGRSENVRRVQDVLYAAVPVPDRPCSPFPREAVHFIAIDVSASMAQLLRQEPIVTALRSLVSLHADAQMIAVDTSVRARDSGPYALDRILALAMSGSTELLGALSRIPTDHLLVITDEEGAGQLARLGDGCMGFAIVRDGEIVWQGRAETPSARGTTTASI